MTSFVASQNDHDLIMIMYRINVLLLVTSLVASQNALEAPLSAELDDDGGKHDTNGISEQKSF